MFYNVTDDKQNFLFFYVLLDRSKIIRGLQEV